MSSDHIADDPAPTPASTTDTSHFLDVSDLSPAELASVLDDAAAYKQAVEEGAAHADLPGQTLAMLFEKPSTRTRVSFETGMTQLGGHAIFLGPGDTQLERGEPIKDTARALSGYVDAITARVHSHETLEELSAYASVPVVNALSEKAHPCQTLADLLTIQEVAAELAAVGELTDLQVTWVGDSNNVAQSFVVGASMLGMDVTVATPEGYEFPAATVETAESYEGSLTETTDPAAAIEGADVVYTDVWVNMGEEDEREQKLAAFEGFTLDSELLAAAPEATVMHCLPAHRGEEITDEVLESEQSVVFQQAENRMHTEKALLAHLLAA